MSESPSVLLVTIGVNVATEKFSVKGNFSSAVRNGALTDTFVSAQFGVEPYTFAKTAGTLPPGVTFNADGTFTGSYTTQGYYEFTIQATDGAATTDDAVFSITVGGGIVVTNILPYCEVALAYSANLVATGGTGSYTWTLQAGSLPAGFSIVGSTLVGTHASILAPVLETFTLRCTDSGGNFTDAVFGLATWKALTITDLATLYAIENVEYSKKYTASWGDLTNSALKDYRLPTVRWKLETYGFGFLPPGLVFNPATATISGAPIGGGAPGFFDIIATDEMGGTYTFTVLNFVIESIKIPYIYNYLFGDGVSTHFEWLSPFRSNQFVATIIEVATGKEVNCLVSHVHNPPLFPTDDFLVVDTETPPATDAYKLIVVGQ